MSSTIFFFLFIPLLTFILLAVNLIFAPHNPYMEKNSAFECGFSSFLGQNRTQFSISFFIFALLFLLFDLEILLVYPYLVSAYTNGVYGLVVMLVFLLALTLGFAFELGKKALSIDSRQTSNVSTNNKSNGITKVNGNTGAYLNIAKRHYSSSSNNVKFESLIEVKIVRFIWFLSSLVKYFFYFLKSPTSFIYSIIYNQIKTYITYCVTSTSYYIAFEYFCYKFKCIYHEKGLYFSLDMLAFAIPDLFIRFVKHNILDILCFSLLCLYTVYIHFIPISFFFLVAVAILLFFSILYT